MLCLSGFELYSRWVPLISSLSNNKATVVDEITTAMPSAERRTEYMVLMYVARLRHLITTS